MKRDGGTRRATLARRADRYDCYQRSVQEPEAELSVIERVFAGRRGRPPRRLREDFCGTALLACEYAAIRGGRTTACGHNARACAPPIAVRMPYALAS